MKILVTGAAGFVGRNLVENLKNIRDGKNWTRPALRIDEIYEVTRESTPEDLDRYCADCDFVFNLAGVNRPKDPAEFREGNFGFASRLLELADGKSGPLVPSGRPYDASEPESWYTSPATIAHNWKQWCARNGVEHVTDENMRSSYATMMGEALVPDSVVAGNMGHSDGSSRSRFPTSQ